MSILIWPFRSVTGMQHMLHRESEASQNSIERMQRILNALDTLQHLLYLPSAGYPPLSTDLSRETLMKLFQQTAEENVLSFLSDEKVIRGWDE
jgi:hypothetical protein